MLEEDYLALTKHEGLSSKANHGNHHLASEIIRQIILPQIEKEVNTGKNFAMLRQIFNSLILASWYKKNLKEALLTQVYADKSMVNGINGQDPKIKERIYKQYVEAYKKGVFNFIKEEEDPVSRQVIAHKYFSGGVIGNMAMLSVVHTVSPDLVASVGNLFRFSIAALLNPAHFITQHPVAATALTFLGAGGIYLVKEKKKFYKDRIRKLVDQMRRFNNQPYDIGTHLESIDKRINLKRFQTQPSANSIVLKYGNEEYAFSPETVSQVFNDLVGALTPNVDLDNFFDMIDRRLLHNNLSYLYGYQSQTAADLDLPDLEFIRKEEDGIVQERIVIPTTNQELDFDQVKEDLDVLLRELIFFKRIRRDVEGGFILSLLPRKAGENNLELLNEVARLFGLTVGHAPSGSDQIRDWYGFRFNSMEDVELFHKVLGPSIVRWLMRQQEVMGSYSEQSNHIKKSKLVHLISDVPKPLRVETSADEVVVDIGGEHFSGNHNKDRIVSILQRLYWDSSWFYHGIEENGNNFRQQLIDSMLLDMNVPVMYKAIARQYAHLGLKLNEVSRPILQNFYLETKSSDRDRFLIQLNLLRSEIAEDLRRLGGTPALNEIKPPARKPLTPLEKYLQSLQVTNQARSNLEVEEFLDTHKEEYLLAVSSLHGFNAPGRVYGSTIRILKGDRFGVDLRSISQEVPLPVKTVIAHTEMVITIDPRGVDLKGFWEMVGKVLKFHDMQLNSPSFYKFDQAQIVNRNSNEVEGGIDLSNAGMTVRKGPDGGVKINFDPTIIEDIRRKGVRAMIPVVLSVSSISSVLPLLGMSLDIGK